MQILEEVIVLYKTGAVGPGLRAAADKLSAEQLKRASTDILFLLDFQPIMRSMRSENLRSFPKRLEGLRTFVDSADQLKALFSVSDQAELSFRDPSQSQAIVDFVRSKTPLKIERTLF